MFFRRKLIYLILPVLGLGLILLNTPREQIAHGVIRDEAGTITGAVVRLRGSDRYVLTDAQGAFWLPIESNDDRTRLTAWASGYFIAGADLADFTDSDGGVFLLQAHPTNDNPDYVFVSPLLDTDNPTACFHCHQTKTTNDSGLTLPVDEWLLDAHASAAINPRFLSLYNGTTVEGVRNVPTQFEFDAQVGVNIPIASNSADAGFRLDFPEQSGSCATCHVPIMALQNPYQADPNQAVGVAKEGITCDFCHKIQNVRVHPNGLPNPGLPGVLSIDFLRPPATEQLFMGPFDDTAGDDIYSPLQDASQFCAACHTGQFWDVPIYNSFGEWLDSPYSDPDTGRTCQDCHMPHTDATRFAKLPPDNPLILTPRDPDTIFSHRMPGAADQELLQHTASLEVETQRLDEQLRVVVRVTNTGAGHHIPTDNPLRNLILWVQATNATEQPLTLVEGSTIAVWGGQGDPNKGYYAGQPGVLYAKVLADFYTGETPTYAYWRQTRLVSDNRIPALTTDETAYVFAISPDSGTITVDVRLYLRRAFIALMEHKEWNMPDILMEQQVVNLP